MPLIQSRLDSRSPQFSANRAQMQALVADLKAKVARIAEGGGEVAMQRHTARGKLPVRERIQLLLDAGSPFLEIGQLAAHEVYGEDVPAAGVVAGIGRINGQECMVVGNDATTR